MYKIAIDSKEYIVKDKWEDITIEEAIQLEAIEIPEDLAQYWEALINEKEYKLSNRQTKKTFPKYYNQVLELLSDIPEGIILATNPEQVTNLFNNTLRLLVMDLIYYPQYKPNKPKTIEFDGETYYFPKSMMVLEMESSFVDRTAKEWAEAADQRIAITDLEDGGMKHLPFLCAVVLKKEGEQYDEEKAIERAEIFKGLPMSVAWEVFFCLIGLIQKQKRGIKTSLQRKVKSMLRKQQRQAD